MRQIVLIFCCSVAVGVASLGGFFRFHGAESA